MRTLQLAALLLLLAPAPLLAPAQSPQPAKLPATVPIQSIGSVGLEEATVSGDLILSGGRAMITGASIILAGDHTADVALRRGGDLRVCATSTLHLSQGRGAGAQPLMFALDRGAIEITTTSVPNDLVLTPDLRFTLRSAGPLDLRLRVTRNGDTCVENRGSNAPLLGITDQFGDSTYELHPNQHVLFEHGSLKEVVDHETSPCGCPAPLPATGTLTAGGAPQPASSPAAAQAAADHPFPAAISEGLAPPSPIPQAAPGAPHAEVAATLGYTGDGTGTIAGTPVIAAPAPSPTAAPAPRPLNRGLGHRIGRFFKRVFG